VANRLLGLSVRRDPRQPHFWGRTFHTTGTSGMIRTLPPRVTDALGFETWNPASGPYRCQPLSFGGSSLPGFPFPRP
jgi:hypothetical protein